MDKKERRAALVAELRAMNEKTIAEKREFTDEEAKLYAEKEAEMRKLSAEIAAEERAAALAGFADKLPTPNGEQREVTDQMKEFRHFLMTGEKRTDVLMTVGDGGAALAPQEFVKDLIKEVEKENQLFGLVKKVPVTGAGSLGLPYEEDDASDAAWTTEIPASDITEDKKWKFGLRELKPIDLTKLIKVSKKLVKASALPIEKLAGEKIIQKLSEAIENGIVNGTGTNQPLGIFTASDNGIPTSRDVASTYTSATDYVTSDDFIKVKMSLRPAYRRKARWVMNTSVLSDVMLFKDKNDQYIWQPGLKDGEPDKLLGLPVIESEYAPATKTSGAYVAVLGDFDYYQFAYWEGLDVQVLSELFALRNQYGFLGHTLADGMPTLGKAFARLKVGA